jgi:ABC transport system ATP-binding/permease protein
VRLVAEVDGEAFVAEPGKLLIIGRDVNADVPVENSRVSRQHLRISFDQGQWTFRDLSSANGTFLEGRAVHTGVITNGLVLRIGGTGGSEIFFSLISSGSVTRETPRAKTNSNETASVTLAAGVKDFRVSLRPRLRIGQASTNDVILDDPDVADAHAEITLRPNGGYSISDLGSKAGVYVNGTRVRRHTLRPGDTLKLGEVQLTFTGSTLETARTSSEDSLSVSGVSVTLGGKKLIQEVSVSFKPASLTAILGPSGAGKSTFLSALTAQTKTEQGEIAFGDWDLLEDFDQVRHRIGFVPQSDILHTNLTTRQALTYGAKLRFPKDTERSFLEDRVEQVLEELELTAKADLKVEKLSGGQRKRASVALELLTEPDLLFLDEPTSGLDPGLDRQVMTILQKLARRGKTVIVVTHSTDNLDLADDVLLLRAGGRLAYFGSPQSALQTFKQRTWAPVFEALMEETGAALSVESLDGGSKSSQKFPREDREVTVSKDWAWQLLVLITRNVKVMTSDGPFFGFLIILPFLMAMVGLLAGSEFGLSEGPVSQAGLNPSARSLLLVMVLAGVFIGASSSIQELVKERAIFAREKSVGLSPSAYITSKVFVLSLLVIFQTSVFTVITLIGRPLPEKGVALGGSVLFEIVVGMSMLGLVSMAIGLFVSAYSNSREQTMPVLVGVTMIQVVLSGAVPLSVEEILGSVSNIVPAFWSTNMLAATIDLNSLSFLLTSDYFDFWDSSSGNWALSASVLGAAFLTLIVVTILRVSTVRASR